MIWMSRMWGTPREPRTRSHWPLGREMLALIAIGEAAMAVVVWTEAIDPDDALLFSLVPIGVRCAVWAISAALALAAIATRSRFLTKTAWGFVVAMPSFRAISYAWAALMSVWPGPPDPAPDNLALAVTWGVVSLAITRMARKTEAAA